MHGYGAKVTFSEQGHFIGASMPLFAKKQRFGAVFARLMNVTDRKYEVICTNGKIIIRKKKYDLEKVLETRERSASR